MLDGLINLAITQLWQVTLLILVVGLAHRLLVDRAPHLALSLWTIVAIKAVTPPLFASPLGVFSWVQASSVVEQPSQAMLAIDWTPGAGSPALWWLTALGVVWLAGSTICLALVVWRHRTLSRLLRRDALPATDALTQYTTDLAERYQLRRPSRVVVSQDELGPAVAGVLRPTIILPASLVNDSDPAALRPVLLHELVHTTRRDTLTAVLHTTNRIVWWFNPMVWWATRQAESLVERCVDLAVTRDLQTSLLEYGRGLLRVLELRKQLQPRPELASLSPCQITTERLTFLRSTDFQNGVARNGAAKLPRRLAMVTLAAIVLPALPVDALVPTCKPSLASLAPQTVDRNEAVSDEPMPAFRPEMRAD